VPRDLRFHPSAATSPKVLTRDQVERFNRDGYLMPVRVFSSEEAADLRGYFDRLLAKYLAEGKDSYSISSAHLRHGRVWDVLTNPRIVAVVADLLGPSVVGWGSHFFCKMPGDGKSVSWHQDASYWPLTPSKAVTVWVAIDDADRGNACMRFIPGTHVLGHLTYQLSEMDEANVLNQTVPDIEKYGDPVYAELKAGEASVHSDLLLHGSEANTSGRRRCGLTLRYTPGNVRAYLGWGEKGVVVSGGDPPAPWANRPRPTEE
jgi:ectoine hydroxylase-related dioxygenase (phytanoyl-CoA dioxygenase family)